MQAAHSTPEPETPDAALPSDPGQSHADALAVVTAAFPGADVSDTFRELDDGRQLNERTGEITPGLPS